MLVQFGCVEDRAPLFLIPNWVKGILSGHLLA
jgi:hypothetical protein